LAEELSHTAPAEQPTSTKTHSHAVTSLFTSNIYYTQTYYKVTNRHIGTPLSHLEKNSNQLSTTNHNYLLRPSQPANRINKGNNIFYPFTSSIEWAQVA